MKYEDVHAKVVEAIADSCGIDETLITNEKTLFVDLEISSIDLVDIFYTLEMEYDISMKISDMENEAIKEMDGVPFEIDNIITTEGLEALKRKMPEINAEKLVQGLTVNDIINLITVESLYQLVVLKIEQKTT